MIKDQEEIFKKTGLPKEYADNIANVAKRHWVIIGCRPIDSYARRAMLKKLPGKTLHVKLKSCNFGIAINYIPLNPELSKHAGLENGPALYQKYNSLNKKGIKNGHITIVDLVLTEEDIKALEKDLKITKFPCTQEGVVDHKFTRPNDHKIMFSRGRLDPSANPQEIHNKYKMFLLDEGVETPIKVMADPKTEKPYAPDLDLAFVISKKDDYKPENQDRLIARFPSNQVREDFYNKAASSLQKSRISTSNSSIDNEKPKSQIPYVRIICVDEDGQKNPSPPMETHTFHHSASSNSLFPQPQNVSGATRGRSRSLNPETEDAGGLRYRSTGRLNTRHPVTDGVSKRIKSLSNISARSNSSFSTYGSSLSISDRMLSLGSSESIDTEKEKGTITKREFQVSMDINAAVGFNLVQHGADDKNPYTAFEDNLPTLVILPDPSLFQFGFLMLESRDDYEIFFKDIQKAGYKIPNSHKKWQLTPPAIRLTKHHQ